MTIHASDFGWLSNLISIFLSIGILFVFVRATRFLVGIDRIPHHFLITFIVLGSALFLVVPIVISIGIGNLLHWMHFVVHGPYTYGNTGYENSYNFGSQLFMLGAYEFLYALYKGYQSYIHTDKTSEST
jgi:hypothetical protein